MPNTARRAANLSIRSDLVEEAKEFKVNMSRAAEQGIARAIAEEKAKRWLEENAEAIKSWNEYVEKNGLPLAKYRQF